MNIDASAHLTEEALNDALIGLGSADMDSHLAVCGACREKLEAFEADMQVFNDTSLHWSQARSSAMPLIEAPQRKQNGLFVGAAWAFVAALVLLVCVPAVHLTRFSSMHHHTQSFQAADSESQIAQDNELLQAVNVAVNADDFMPIDEDSVSTRNHLHSDSHRSGH